MFVPLLESQLLEHVHHRGAPVLLSSQTPPHPRPPLATTGLLFCHHGILLPILEYSINGALLYLFFLWSDAFPPSNAFGFTFYGGFQCFLFSAECSFMVGTHRVLLTHLSVDIHSSLFPALSKNDAANICVQSAAYSLLLLRRNLRIRELLAFSEIVKHSSKVVLSFLTPARNVCIPVDAHPCGTWRYHYFKCSCCGGCAVLFHLTISLNTASLVWDTS